MNIKDIFDEINCINATWIPDESTLYTAKTVTGETINGYLQDCEIWGGKYDGVAVKCIHSNSSDRVCLIDEDTLVKIEI